ncbi:molybdate ABC transporter substrate-binding protein [Nocardioides alcanivorans]|uniref:molybdate ABC transporter substrate-binding protein n=1 Tax=Nocardioides alcanivorans TaxID=2897352 RepID=UPI001F2337E0|nr:molybdate ABC transporter substrate-binding protein [Nocardioides alcanivorans]
MKRILRGPALAAVALLLAGGLTACGDDDNGSGSDKDVTLTVFAAASLTSTFTEIGEKFEAENDGVTVNFNFAGSSDLVAQIQQGAPADVFASADENNMTKATDDDLTAEDPELFATNVLTIVTEPGNPEGITSLADLANDDLTVVLCAPEVPCGAASTRVEEAAGVDIAPASEESSVTDVLNKVTSGEADAGLVYVTDAKNAGDAVTAVEFAESAEAVNNYPIAALEDSEHGDLAQAFVDYVLGSVGQGVLAAAGFGQP